MRISEFLPESNLVQEIVRLPAGEYRGGERTLALTDPSSKTIKPLPGGSGFLYSVTKEPQFRGLEGYDIKIFDPKVTSKSPARPVRAASEFPAEYEERLERWKKIQKTNTGKLIGHLSVDGASGGFPLKGALQVDTVTVHEDYRGMGIAKALYGIVLTIMKRPLLSGESQTPSGRRMWVSLSQIPGVEMKGYVALDDEAFENVYASDSWAQRANKEVEQTIDTLMGQLGGEYIGKADHDVHVFAFDVQPNTTSTEIESYVKSNMSKVYGTSDFDTGLYAIWTGK